MHAGAAKWQPLFIFVCFKFPIVIIHTDFSGFKDLETAVTIGTFDGVHLGHRAILSRLLREAQMDGFQSVILTFYPHPRMVLHPEDHALQLLSTPEEKAELLKELGIDHLMVYPFSEEFSRISAFDYVRNLLVNGLNAKKIIVGYDHRFGRNREGDFSTLSEWSEILQYKSLEIPAEEIDNVNISSTKIRKYLLDGNVSQAATYLGYPYALTGKIVHGNKMGRTLGFPTANMSVNYPYKLIPANGVYAVECKTEKGSLKGVMNIGVRPTVDSTPVRHIEAHLLDFEGDLYGQNLTVRFIQKIREEKKFGSIDELKNQIHVDVQTTRTLFQ